MYKLSSLMVLAVRPPGDRNQRGGVKVRAKISSKRQAGPLSNGAAAAALTTGCARLLETHHPSKITSEMLLQEAGVARGTLYLHFKGVAELIETALLDSFSTNVDANIVTLGALLRDSENARTFAAGLRELTRVTQARDRRDARYARARLISYSGSSPKLRASLAREQERLTSAISKIVAGAQKRGWVKKSIKPRAAAVLIQAYTLGKIVDDVAETQMPESDWNELIDQVVISGMLTRKQGKSS